MHYFDFRFLFTFSLIAKVNGNRTCFVEIFLCRLGFSHKSKLHIHILLVHCNVDKARSIPTPPPPRPSPISAVVPKDTGNCDNTQLLNDHYYVISEKNHSLISDLICFNGNCNDDTLRLFKLRPTLYQPFNCLPRF